MTVEKKNDPPPYDVQAPMPGDVSDDRLMDMESPTLVPVTKQEIQSMAAELLERRAEPCRRCGAPRAGDERTEAVCHCIPGDYSALGVNVAAWTERIEKAEAERDRLLAVLADARERLALRAEKT